MRTPAWQRVVARIVLVTFTTGIVACGDATRDAASSSTTVPEAQVNTTVPPPPETVPPPPPANPPPMPPSTLPAEAPAQISKQELRDLVAPIALYPDVVLSSLLPATTYPEQVHDAAVYVGDAEQVDRIPDDRGWDGSIVGLLQFPDVIRWLDENPAWTDQMGQAVTYQQGDVLEAIQDYRKAVKNVGNLQSNQYQKVRTGQNQDVYIEPARPDVVYVPSYDPVVATQPQPPAESPGINPWIAFGGGALVGALGAWALYSIFDDDDDDHYYYGGRRIRGYDNYYYARGRRPRTVVWAPRQRPWRQVNGWREPRRLRYVAPAARPGRRAVALRPPTKRVGAPPPYAAEMKRDQRQLQKQERRDRQQQKQLEQQTQRQEKQQRQLEQKQQRQQRNQAQKQQQQERRQQKQTQQRDRRQQQQIQKQEQQNQRQERRQQQQMEQRERRQDQQMQRQEHRQEQQMQRQERRQEKKAQQQNQGGNGGGGGGGGKGNNKKKKGNQ